MVSRLRPSLFLLVGTATAAACAGGISIGTTRNSTTTAYESMHILATLFLVYVQGRSISIEPVPRAVKMRQCCVSCSTVIP